MALAKKLGINLSLDVFVGRNKELAKRRSSAIQELLANGLKTAGITNVTIPQPTVTVGKTKWDKKKTAGHKDYSDEQFMNVSVEASGTKVVKQQLPDFCKKPFVPKGGGQASKGNGWKVYKGEGWDIDMGDGEGQITLEFDAKSLPDMFEIVYNGETYRSKNPDTQEQGFVSGRFEKLSEDQVKDLEMTTAKNTKSLEDLQASIKKYGYDRPVVMGNQKRTIQISNWFPLSDRVVLNFGWEEKGESETYALDANNESDLQWFKDFYTKFPNEKDFIRFKGDGTREMGRKAAGLSKKETKGLWSLISSKYKRVQQRPKKVKKEMEKLKDEILSDSTEITYNKKYGGNYSQFIKSMDQKIKIAGFSEGIVGPNGQITFNKVSGVNNMSLQVYAPIGGTVWDAKVGCKASSGTAV